MMFIQLMIIVSLLMITYGFYLKTTKKKERIFIWGLEGMCLTILAVLFASEPMVRDLWAALFG